MTRDEGNEMLRQTEAPLEPGTGTRNQLGESTSTGARILAALSPRRLSAVYLLLLFIIVFGISNTSTFLTSGTFTVVLSTGAVTCILALAFLVPLIAGNYDLSIGAMLTFALTLTVQLSLVTPLPVYVNALIALVACAIIGAINGFLIVKLHVNSFIATLGMSQVLLAAVLLISGNLQLNGSFPASWSFLGNGRLLGIPIPFLFVLLIGLIMWYVVEQTPVGRNLLATGANMNAARLSGVRTDRLVWGSMVTSAVIAGIAGVLYSAQIGVATSTVGDGRLFPAITAVFLGASQLSMRPNVWGTIIAYVALATGVQGLQLATGAAAAWAGPLFQGIALVVAVAIASRPLVKKVKASRATRTAEAAGNAKIGER